MARPKKLASAIRPARWRKDFRRSPDSGSCGCRPLRATFSLGGQGSTSADDATSAGGLPDLESI